MSAFLNLSSILVHLISNQKDLKIIPIWKAIYIQDRASPLIEHINFLHDHIIILLVIITFFVLFIMWRALTNKFFNRFFSENHEIEYFWTSLPAFLLLFLAFPSIKILYISEEYNNPSITVKSIGHQWYWSYEYPDLNNLEFDSFLKESSIIRLLDTSNHLILPINTTIRILISSEDVIHSWTIPSLGVKVDALPGRINQVFLNINRVGIFVGQCSEICGANHRFIPITISAISINKFLNSISSNGRVRHWPLKPNYSICFWWIPQISPINWTQLVFWFIIITNFIKTIFRIEIRKSSTKINQNKISINTINITW